jgi:glycosyltransferase involved in cell wall biosynthesis
LVVSTYENPSGLETCLLGVLRQSRAPERVVIADDGSGEETRRLIDRYRDRLPLEHVWHPDEGFRLAAIRNRALARCREQYVVLLDGDTMPHHHFLRDHAEYARPGRLILGQRCALVGYHGKVLRTEPGALKLATLFLLGRILNDSRALKMDFVNRLRGLRKGLRLPRAILTPSDYHQAHGGNLGAWREDLIAVNGCDERFVGWGGEDADLVERLTRAGREPYRLLHRAVCYHIDHPVNAANKRNSQLLHRGDRPVRCRDGLDRHLGSQSELRA